MNQDPEEQGIRAAAQMAEATERLRDKARRLSDLPAQRQSSAPGQSQAAGRRHGREPGDEPATFRTTAFAGHAVLVVEGQVDMHGAPSLRRCLLELLDAGHIDVIVDLSAVDFMDSSGLSVLVNALKAARQSGGTLRVVATSRHLEQLFRVTGVERVLPVHASVAAAATAAP